MSSDNTWDIHSCFRAKGPSNSIMRVRAPSQSITRTKDNLDDIKEINEEGQKNLKKTEGRSNVSASVSCVTEGKERGDKMSILTVYCCSSPLLSMIPSDTEITNTKKWPKASRIFNNLFFPHMRTAHKN